MNRGRGFGRNATRAEPSATTIGRIDVSPYFRLCLFIVPDDPRQKNALLVAASLIAAVPTAKEERIDQSPRVVYKVGVSSARKDGAA